MYVWAIHMLGIHNLRRTCNLFSLFPSSESAPKIWNINCLSFTDAGWTNECFWFHSHYFLWPISVELSSSNCDSVKATGQQESCTGAWHMRRQIRGYCSNVDQTCSVPSKPGLTKALWEEHVVRTLAVKEEVISVRSRVAFEQPQSYNINSAVMKWRLHVWISSLEAFGNAVGRDWLITNDMCSAWFNIWKEVVGRYWQFYFLMWNISHCENKHPHAN